MIYLLETGICLSLLYLAYWLFLRKETYFNFNRIFLVASIALSLLVPLLHVNVLVSRGSSLEQTATGIEKVRDSYEEMIRMINADYGTEPGARHSAAGEGAGERMMGEGGSIPTGSDQVAVIANGIKISKILLILYIGGVVWFLARFVYLVIRLYLLARRNRVTRQDGFRMVEIEEQISPFSFFRFLFINNGSFDEPELHQVLEHEKAHISQRHSMDHLFAHGLAVFQWFNPIAWQIRKALKTTHEYIADRQVIDRGVECQDYQSLLLRQVIGYHSVELVNNFNLKPIKKRIAMMNKTKSGVQARFKAALVAPFAILVFFLFADFTLKGSSAQNEPVKELEGLWIKQSKDDFPSSIFIDANTLSFSEDLDIKTFDFKESEGKIILSFAPAMPNINLKYQRKGNELALWWNDENESHYVKSKARNTLDHWIRDHETEVSIDLPSISQFRLLDENLLYRICYGKDPRGGTTLTFNGKTFNLLDLGELVEKEKSKLNKLDQRSITALFFVDRSIPMVLVDQVRQELRKSGALHIAEGGYPHGDMELSPLLYHAVALPRLLPPKNAKFLDKAEVEKKGGKVHTIDLSARNTNPRAVDQNLKEFIRNTGDNRYVISLEYDGSIPYGQYVETVDMIYNVVYSFRIALAEEKYGAPYDKLGDELQRELRKVYPMALSETMK
ncbi:MAG: M56 family metallopeptidase [Bacteroidetes bacterium]|nr:M56 family metallopeptidase [Bacteroidota bacterium]